MDKKSIIALALIAVIILLLPYYQELLTGDQPVQKQQVTSQKTDSSKLQEKPQNVASDREEKQIQITESASPDPIKNELQQSVVQDTLEKVFTIENDKIQIILSNKNGGSLKSFVLKNYTKYDSSNVNMISNQINNDIFLAFQNTKGEYIDLADYLFQTKNITRKKYLKENEKFKIRFFLEFEQSTLSKTYIFYADSYHFDVVVNFSNPNQLLLNNQYQFGWVNGLPSTESYEEDDNNYNQVYVYIAEELEEYSISEEGPQEQVSLSGRADWFAIRTKYFIAAVSGLNANLDEGVYFSGTGLKKENYVQRIYDAGYNVRHTYGQSGDTMRVYMGPLDINELSSFENDLDLLIMNNGWYERIFRFFSLIVLQVLQFLHGFIPNYGIVIILFSILIKIIVYPLTKKSYQSMKQMQNVQPLMQEMREKYKNDPQRLNKETMKLYKEHGVNPLGGCLPMLLQMPLLIALFIVFRSTIQLRGASFIPGWIDDLSRTDTLFNLPFSLPLYGDEFNLLPILMAVTMLFQSKMTMQDPKQKAMVYIMPIFMLLIFNRFPSGLNLYYTMFNLLTIIQQKFIHTDTSKSVNTGKSKTGNKKKK